MKAKELVKKFADEENWRLTEEECMGMTMAGMYVASMHGMPTKELVIRELRHCEASPELIEKVEEDYMGSVAESMLRTTMNSLNSQLAEMAKSS